MADQLPSDIRAILEAQRDELDALEDEAARRVLVALEAAAVEVELSIVRLALSGADVPFSAFQLDVTMAQVEAGVDRLTTRLVAELDDPVRTARIKALDHLIETIEAREPEFRQAATPIRLSQVERLSRPGATRLHVYSVRRYGRTLTDNIQARLAQSVAQRRTMYQVADDIVSTGIERVMGGHSRVSIRQRAELIARMEIGSAHSDETVEVTQDAAAELDQPDDDDPLLLRISELRDNRTTAISWVLDGQAVGPGEQYRATLAEVEAAAIMHSAKTTGIIWSFDGSAYVGTTLPAHFGERGMQHAWRRSWAT